jgi:signal peptidase I
MEAIDTGMKKLWQEAVSFIVTVGLLLGLAFLIIRPTFIEPFQIPSSSMVPTLQISDRILVNKLAYGLRIAFMTDTITDWKLPSRGDVVVFTRPDEATTPQNESETNFIKRVIGLPGDTVEVRGTEVYINGALSYEPYARYSRGGIEQGNFGPDIVPEGHVFLLGDNRDDSKDSRFWEEHYLDMKRIKGRAFMIYWSWAGFDRLGTIIR